MDWIHLPQDKEQWQALLNTVMSFQIPWNVGKLLSSLETDVF
jgi:hypothetical protein